MITESLGYLRTSDDCVKTVVIGGFLTLFGVLVVPTTLVAGYPVRVLRATMYGDETPPRFDDWRNLADDGLRGFVIAIAYGLVPTALIATTAVFARLATGPGPRSDPIVGSVALVGSLLAADALPAALASYARQGSVRDGVAVGDLRPVLTSGTSATAWATGFATVLSAAAVTALLDVVPLLGPSPGRS